MWNELPPSLASFGELAAATLAGRTLDIASPERLSGKSDLFGLTIDAPEPLGIEDGRQDVYVMATLRLVVSQPGAIEPLRGAA